MSPIEYMILTSFATSTPVLFAVILLISSKEFSHDEIKKNDKISKALRKKEVWLFEKFICKNIALKTEKNERFWRVCKIKNNGISPFTVASKLAAYAY
jgi:hypothetical protein